MAIEQLTESTGQAQKKRRRSAKPIKPNDDVERYYRTQLRSLVRSMRRAVDDEVMPVIKAEKAEYTGDATPTTDDWAARVTAALQRVAERFVSSSFEAIYRRMARNVVERTENQTTESLTKSVNQAVGVDITPLLSESEMNDFVTASIESNVSLIKSFPEEYFKRVEGTIYRGMLDGVTPSSIASQISADTGVSERRAKLVARDQVGSITSQVTERRQKQAGIKYYQSIDAGDERVSGRPGGRYPNAKISCWGIARRDIGYGKGVYLMSEGASWGGETGLHPGRHHPLCFPAGTRVAASEVRATMSRRFEGDLVTIRTASGKELTATPNHPILTGRGWVAIGEMTKSDYVVCASGVDVEAGLYPDNKDVVSRIEDVSASLFMSRGVLPVKMEVAPEDFHGDGTNGDVCVVYTDCPLDGEGDVASSDLIDNSLFKRAFNSLASLLGLSRSHASLNRDGSAFGGFVSGAYLMRSFIGAHSAPLKGFGLRLVSYVDAALLKYAPDYVSGNTKMLGSGVFGVASGVHLNNAGFREVNAAAFARNNPRLGEVSADSLGVDAKLSRQVGDCAPSGIFFDHVIGVTVESEVVCHVYNLETYSGAYLAEGIITHNCRCTSKPIFDWEVE